MTPPSARKEWTKTQKDVWKTVENYTAKIMKGEVEGFLKFFHKDYSGWNYLEYDQVKKSDIKKELQNLPKVEVIDYNIDPVSIQIVNDIAIVHYYYSAKYKNPNGEQKSKTGHYTDILMKEEESWLLVGDHVENDSPFDEERFKET